MKIIIIGINRSATTAVSQLFAQKYTLLNYGEIFFDDNNRVPLDLRHQERSHAEYITELLQTSSNFVCKIMPAAFVPRPQVSNVVSYMAGVNYPAFDFSIFDKFVFTQRNVIDQIASMLAVNIVFQSQVKSHEDSITSDDRRSLYKNFSGNVDVSDNMFISIQKQFEIYHGMREMLYAMYPDKCSTVTYEMLQLDATEAMSQFASAVNLPFTANDYLTLTTQKTHKDYRSAITNYSALVDQVQQYNLYY